MSSMAAMLHATPSMKPNCKGLWWLIKARLEVYTICFSISCLMSNIVVILLNLSGCVWAPFVVTGVDSPSLVSLGSFPFDRTLLIRSVSKGSRIGEANLRCSLGMPQLLAALLLNVGSFPNGRWDYSGDGANK